MMNKEDIEKAKEILRQPITVNSVDYKYFTQEQYNNLTSVYDSALWLLGVYEQLEDKLDEMSKYYREAFNLQQRIDKVLDFIETWKKEEVFKVSMIDLYQIEEWLLGGKE